MSGTDPWAPVAHEDAPEPTAEKPIKVAAHTRAPRQSTEPKEQATLPLSLNVAVPTDLMDGIRTLVEHQQAVIAKMDDLIDKIDALVGQKDM